jgi:hypothetical protein
VLVVPMRDTRVQTIMTHIVPWLLEGAGLCEDEDNDDKFPDESPVEVRYPSSRTRK